MPILHIEIVGDPEDFKKDLAQRIADAAGSVLNSRQQGTWVKLHFLNETAYAENGRVVEELPILVSLTQAELPTGGALKEQVMNLARALARVTDHPVENVHIVVEPAAKGRIAFGGILVE